MQDTIKNNSPTESRGVPRRELTLVDSTSIIVGIIIGSGIYLTAPTVASQTPSWPWLIGVWTFGGFLSLAGALCYAELGNSYPREGGDYVYLNRAYGRAVGFLFAWSQLWIVRPGSIGAMAFAFAVYANRIWPQATGENAAYVLVAYAAASVVALSGINILGVREGKWTQNVLTAAKVVGLLAFMAVGFLYSSTDVSATAAATNSADSAAVDAWSFLTSGQFGFAMILVLFTYGGWNEMAFVCAEVKEPRKNILRALLLGTAAVTVIYVLANMAFYHALGLQGMRSMTAATDVLELAVGSWAGHALSFLICVSALGAINGQIFTGSRIYYAMGADHRLYSWLGRWDDRRGTPVRSLVVQTIITLGLIVWFGLKSNGFTKMVNFTAPAFWFFLLLVGASVFVLRIREPYQERPYRTLGYPVTPIVFCLSCGFMVYSSVTYALNNQSKDAIWSIALLALGVLFCVPAMFDKKEE